MSQAPLSRRVDSFLDQLDIVHEPHELLGRFFLTVATAAAEEGIFFEFGTFDDLMDVNRANADTWFPITTTFRPDEGGANTDNGFVVFGRNLMGDIVSCQAARRFDWRQSSLRHEAEALRLFYADPTHQKAPKETCRVETETADIIRGCVAYTGGLWFRPDFRGHGRAGLITRVGRAYALAKWGFDHLFGIITPENLGKNFHRRTGFKTVAPKSVVMSNSPSKPDGDLHMTLVHMTPLQLVDDLYAMLLRSRTEVDAVIGDRRA